MATSALLGAGVLGASLSSPPGSRRFYLLSLAAAGTWAGGSLLSGPLHLGWIDHRDNVMRRPLSVPTLTGVGAFGVFYGCALLARRVPFLRREIGHVLQFADEGSAPLVVSSITVNAVAEEMFFRGALFTAVDKHHPVVASSLVYTLATVPTRNPALVLAAALMGPLFGVQRRASQGVQASTLTHVTWSMLMLRYLPPLFAPNSASEAAR